METRHAQIADHRQAGTPHLQGRAPLYHVCTVGAFLNILSLTDILVCVIKKCPTSLGFLVFLKVLFFTLTLWVPEYNWQFLFAQTSHA